MPFTKEHASPREAVSPDHKPPGIPRQRRAGVEVWRLTLTDRVEVLEVEILHRDRDVGELAKSQQIDARSQCD
jgi:hypothetical protein